MRALVISLQSEFYKSRKTLAFWASILLPLIICSLVTAGFYTQSAKILARNLPPVSLWVFYIVTILGVMGSLILPFYVIFMAFSVNNIEHKNDTWKSLFAQPLNKFSIYTAKYLYAVILVFICMFLFAVLNFAAGHLLHALNNNLKFNEFSPVDILYTFYMKLFLSSLGTLSLQFIISLIWSDFLKPMGVGFLGLIIGLIAASTGWKYAFIIPYSHATLVLSKVSSKKQGAVAELFTTEIWASLAFAVIFFLIGYFIVLKKSVK